MQSDTCTYTRSRNYALTAVTQCLYDGIIVLAVAAGLSKAKSVNLNSG